MDFDPRDYDSRDDDRLAFGHQRGGRGTSHDDLDRDDRGCPRRAPIADDDARELGRGPGDSRQSNGDGHDPRDDARWPERDRDPRDVFTRDLDLPRGREREIVRDRDREYTLRGSESRTLATVGAFRVVSSRDLRDHHDRPPTRAPATCGICASRGWSRPSGCPVARPRGVADEGRPQPAREPSRPRPGAAARRSTRALNASGSSNTTSRSIAPTNAKRSAWKSAARASIASSWTTSSSATTSGGCTSAIATATTTTATPIATADEIEEWAREHDLPYFDDAGPFP